MSATEQNPRSASIRAFSHLARVACCLRVPPATLLSGTICATGRIFTEAPNMEVMFAKLFQCNMLKLEGPVAQLVRAADS